MPGLDLIPAPAQPQLDMAVTQKYLSPPASTPPYDLAEFDSVNSSVTMSVSLGIASVVPSDVLPVVAGFMPLNPQGSQESHLSSEQLSPNCVRSYFYVDTVRSPVSLVCCVAEIQWCSTAHLDFVMLFRKSPWSWYQMCGQCLDGFLLWWSPAVFLTGTQFSMCRSDRALALLTNALVFLELNLYLSHEASSLFDMYIL